PSLDPEEPKALFDGEAITALATTKEPNFVLFNEDLREEAGIELPTDWDLEEYLEVIHALAGSGRYGTYRLPDLPRIELGPNYWYTDQGTSNFDHPAFLRHLGLSADLIREGVIFPWSQVLARQVEAYPRTTSMPKTSPSWEPAPSGCRSRSAPKDTPHASWWAGRQWPRSTAPIGTAACTATSSRSTPRARSRNWPGSSPSTGSSRARRTWPRAGRSPPSTPSITNF